MVIRNRRDGSHYDHPEEELIKIPNDMTLSREGDPIRCMVQAVYLSIQQNYKDLQFLQQRAILTPKNDIVDQINDFIMDLIPGEETRYFSSDTVCKSTSFSNDDDILYTTKFLNGLQFNGVPRHNLRLKVGVLVMLLRNLNQIEGMCNGTRLLLIDLAKWSVAATIISITQAGNTVTKPRIIMSPNDKKWPFTLRRRQLPLTLCYAMTINKSQGQTLNRVGLFLPKQVFTHGQLYAATSRVKTREGLLILNADDEMEDNTFVKNIVYTEMFQNILPEKMD